MRQNYIIFELEASDSCNNYEITFIQKYML